MQAMSREMQKAGLIEEMMDDIMDDDEELEEEADEEVEKVLEEITLGVKTAPVVEDELPMQKGKVEEDTADLEVLSLILSMFYIALHHYFSRHYTVHYTFCYVSLHSTTLHHTLHYITRITALHCTALLHCGTYDKVDDKCTAGSFG
jgi:hypothetical protein